jgi:cell wall-associated NlpC family hydrolase
MEQLGARYRWGGASPAGFDCSGFTLYAYRQLGIELPRHLWGQLNSGRRVEFEELQPGDLLFFENTYSWGLSHSGLYIGDDQFIHAESEWAGVVISPLRGSNWEFNFAGASRPYEQ